MMYTKVNKQKGFSLVETLVAITILLIVIVGPMTIISTASRSTSFSNEQVIAFFLAQEGAELAQKARDDLVLREFVSDERDAWNDLTDTDNGHLASCFGGGGCGLTMTSDGGIEVTDCSTQVDSQSCRLYLDTSQNASFYSHDSAGTMETPYTRTITFDEISSHELRVTSRVEWFSGLSRDGQSSQIVTSLFNVYDPD